MAVKAISLKYQLVGEVEEFLTEETMECVHTKSGVVELINQISTYKEEGKSLFPEVYIIDELKFVEQSLINSEFIKIGCSKKSPKVILKALKKCAPLAFGGWCIYILRKDDDEFEYGVFRAGATIITVPISKSLIEDGNKESNLILIRQVADKIVELKGVKGNSLIINFGIYSTSEISPLAEQVKFIDKIIEKVDEGIKDQCRIFLSRLFLYVMQNGHGNLSLVLSGTSKYPKFLTDGVVLHEKLSFAKKIKDLIKTSEGDSGLNLLEANSKLNGVFNILSGMMMSDGLTVFTDDGGISAYNVFLKHPENDVELKKIEGGARSRTFAVMKNKLSKNVTAVYIQSQDGKTQTEIS